MLATYYGLRQRPDYIKQIKDKYPDIKIIVDSGCFTFLTQTTKHDVDFYERYTEQYVKFLNKYKAYIYAGVEMDIDSIVGGLAKKWREEIFVPLSKKMPIVFVWHEGVQSIDVWLDYCRRFDYIGIGSDYKSSNYQHLLATARKYLTKVHAFGFTQSTKIQDYDFASIDSTTYLLGSKFGNSNIFNGKTINRYDNQHKDIRQVYRTKFINAGLNWNKIQEEEYYEIIKMNMLSFIEMEEYLSRVNKNRAYWIHKLPKPGKILEAPEEKIKNLMLDRLNIAQDELDGMDMGLTKQLVHLTSLLQWGRYEKFKAGLIEIPEQVVTDWLGETRYKFAKLDDVSLEEFQAAREHYNLSLLKTVAAIPRTVEDFKPVWIPKQREEEWEGAVSLDAGLYDSMA